MAEKKYIERETAYDIATLEDWYINSVSDNDTPVWTEEHLEELLNDFYVIPKDTPAADVAPVLHGCWENPTKKFPYYDWKCSECGCEEYRHIDRHGQYREMNFCPNCGAKMDRSENDRT